jgi:1-phosphatidylinositol phosphodiesterase
MTLDTSHWMDLVAGTKLLSELSIPATHDSGAKNPNAATALEKVRLTTQTRTIFQQLTDGIRFLDIRARHIDNAFGIYHETTSLNLTFDQVLVDCGVFLAAYPRETIIMSIKEEAGPSNNTDGLSFQGRFDLYCTSTSALWYLENRIPTLGEVRGRIVLFRRFALDATTTTARGIDAPFKNGKTFRVEGPPALRIQDNFSVPVSGELDGKYTRVEKILDEAAKPADPDTLYVNFASGAGGSLHTRPLDVANFINPKVIDYFKRQGQARFGIVVTDFETTELNALIIRTNVLYPDGYWIASGDGAVAARGTATDFPVSGPAAREAIAIAARQNGTGYYLVARDGKVYTYGGATHAGEGIPAGTQAVSIAVKPASAEPAGIGYWILTFDGKVSAYHATKYGEIEPRTNLQAVSIVATPNGDGYWILTSNGRIHNYGAADHFGDRRDADQINVSMARTPNGKGYWILSSRGAVHAFGNAVDHGQGVDDGATARAIAATRDGTGYWILSTDGKIYPYGSAHSVGRARTVTDAVGIATDLSPPPAPPAGTGATA